MKNQKSPTYISSLGFRFKQGSTHDGTGVDHRIVRLLLFGDSSVENERLRKHKVSASSRKQTREIGLNIR